MGWCDWLMIKQHPRKEPACTAPAPGKVLDAKAGESIHLRPHLQVVIAVQFCFVKKPRSIQSLLHRESTTVHHFRAHQNDHLRTRVHSTYIRTIHTT